MTTSDFKMGPDEWDAAAATYANHREPLTLPYAINTLTKLRVEPGERLLDLATGTGGAALAAARRGAEVVAVDWSPGMVNFLDARAKGEGIEGITAQVMDGQKLNLPTDHFDAACSIFGIMFFSDHQAGLAELLRVLKPGGRVGLAIWQDSSRMEHLALWKRAATNFGADVLGPHRPTAWVRMDSSEGLRRELERAGFRNISIVPVTHNWEVPSALWFIENFDSSQAFCDRFEPDTRELMRQAVLKELHDKHGDGPFTLTAHAHIGIATK